MKTTSQIFLLALTMLFVGCASIEQKKAYEYTVRRATEKFSNDPSKRGYSRTSWVKEFNKISNELGSEGWRLMEIEKTSDVRGKLTYDDGHTIGTTAESYRLFFEREVAK